jgi:hypothetical protein
MTPKEKAEELFNNFYNHCFNAEAFFDDNQKSTVECALFCVDEILKANHIWYEDSIPYKYWQEVKNELNKQ